MASEEFISLGAPCEADAEDEEGTSLQTMPPNVNGVDPLASECQPEGGPGPMDNTKALDGTIDLEEGEDQVDGEPSTIDSTKVSDVIIDLEEGQVEDMDLSDDDVVVVKHQHLNASIQSGASVAAVQTLHGASVELDKGNELENVCHASKSILIDERPIRGVKRARAESTEPSVCVTYSNLTRESKRKLMELMQQWSEWQTRKQHTLMKAGEEVLECGEKTYYPALHVGSEKSCAVSFWVDNQGKEGVALDDDLVPLYDREFTLGSTPLGDPSNTERADRDDSRCFNCGSYSHALKECPKPRDNAAINNARKQHNLKRNLSNVNRGQNRYYQKKPGKFDDLRPGVLGPETREFLGIRENDPPPWLHRMRELGYPPGYLDVVDDEDKPSGITIFGDEDIKEEYEEGELPDQGEPSSPRKKETVEFPGINGPIPENGDRWLWDSTPPQYSGCHHSSDLREQCDRGPPGGDCYSSRYHTYDYGPASPSHGRYYQDRGRRSSSGYEILPADDGEWTPHAYTSRQYSSQYSTSLEMSSRHSRDRDRYDRHYRHRR